MPITALPASPSRSDPATFSAKADAFLGALPTFVTEANALEVNVNALEAIALGAVTAANTASATALAAANYKGEWTAQSGAATVPYAVSHLGRFWQLASNLADVTAKTPGTAAEWLEIEKDYSCENNTEVIWYPAINASVVDTATAQTLTNKTITSPVVSNATASRVAVYDGSKVLGSGSNTDAELASAVSLKHTQHTDTGTTATSFKINTGGSEADLQTTGLTADRDYAFPDIDTMLAGSVLMSQNTCEIIEYTP
mgnify:CR=1 FL=1